MASLGLLVIGSVVVAFTWSENYGDSTVDISGTFSNAWTAMKQDKKIILLGVVQSFFEASMYTFVFMWTPALQNAAPKGETEAIALPFGVIFACFMVCIMIGSSIFGYMINKLKMAPEEIARLLLLVSLISLAVPIYASNMAVIFFCFLLFEICCGLYFPCLGTLRGKYIPEHTRAATMNFFRVPLNFLVVIVLGTLKVVTVDNSVVFLVCSLWLGVALVLQTQLQRLSVSATKDEDNLVNK